MGWSKRIFVVLFAGSALGCAAVPASPAASPSPVSPVQVARVLPPPVPVVSEPVADEPDLRDAIVASLVPVEPTPPAEEFDEPLAPLVRADVPDTSVSSEARLPPESIRRVVRQSAGRFRDCYQRALLRDVTSSGRVVVRFVIASDGRVARAEEESSSLRDRDARQCVLQAFFDLSFPSSANQRVVVSYPLAFSREGNAAPDVIPSARQTAEPPPPGFAEAMRRGRRVEPPPPAVPPHVPKLRPGGPSRCSPGDPMCGEL